MFCLGGCAWGEIFVVVVVVVVSGTGGVLLFGFLGSRWGCVLWCRGGGGTGLRCRSFGRVGVKDVFCFRERGRGRLQYEWFR